MAEWSKTIAYLASQDAGARLAAAVELYGAGCALGEAALTRWRTDKEFAALLAGPPTAGIAVQPNTFERIRAANGSPPLAEVPPDQEAMEFELRFSSGPGERGVAQLDILTTTPGGGGAIASFLTKFGEGIQQVEYPVAQVDRAAQILGERFGQRPIYPQTRAGAGGTKVNFFLTTTPAGKKALIELVEVGEAGRRR